MNCTCNEVMTGYDWLVTVGLAVAAFGGLSAVCRFYLGRWWWQ